MGKSAVPYVTHSWNWAVGCTPAGAGCLHCWARDLHTKRHLAYVNGKLQMCPQYREPFGVVQILEDRFDEVTPRQQPRVIFVNEMSDTFHQDIPTETIHRAFDKAAECPQHRFLFFTKRFQRAESIISSYKHRSMPPNSGLILSASTQQEVWNAVDVLSRLWNVRPSPSHKYLCGLSLEPLVERVILPEILDMCVDWVIVGGESGKYAKPMHPDWARGLRDQCLAVRVPFYFKQWGRWVPYDEKAALTLHFHSYRFDDGQEMNTCPRQIQAAGKLLDGQEWEQMPARLEVQP